MKRAFKKFGTVLIVMLTLISSSIFIAFASDDETEPHCNLPPQLKWPYELPVCAENTYAP